MGFKFHFSIGRDKKEEAPKEQKREYVVEMHDGSEYISDYTVDGVIVQSSKDTNHSWTTGDVENGTHVLHVNLDKMKFVHIMEVEIEEPTEGATESEQQSS